MTEAPRYQVAAESLEYVPLNHLVRSRIRSSIVNGEYRPGERLQIAVLAKRHGVSAIPVREALRGLEAEGLIDFLPNRSPIVRKLSVEELREVFLIRLPLERLALEHGIPRMERKDFTLLRELTQAMTRSRGNSARWLDLNQEFHLHTYKAAGLPQLTQIIGSLWDSARPYLSVYSAGPSNIRQANADHAALLSACRARNTRLAVRILTTHLTDTRDIVVAAVGSESLVKRSR